MKATINGIQVEGTPEEIAEFDRLVSTQQAGDAPMTTSEVKTIPRNEMLWYKLHLPPQQHQPGVYQATAWNDNKPPDAPGIMVGYDFKNGGE